MDSSAENASPGSVIREMAIDIYANMADEEINILYDKDFRKPIKWLEFDHAVRLLYFIYADGERQDFGVQIKESIGDILKKSDKIALYKIDMVKRVPIASQFVRLKILDESIG